MLSLAMIKTKAETEPAPAPTSSDPKRNFMCCREISKQSKCEKCRKQKKKQKRKQEHGEGTKEGPSQIICHGNQSCCCRRRLWRGLGLELLSWALMFAQHGNNKRNQKPTSTLVRKVLPLNFCECCRKEGGGGGGGNLYPNPRAQSRLRRMPKQLKLLLAKK